MSPYRGVVCLLIAFLGIAACGDNAVLDASTDSGDAETNPPQDASDDDVPPTPDVGPPPGWLHEPVLSVESTERCLDWNPVDRLQRALPDDATPRVLWRYRPTDDPLYDQGAAQLQSFVGAPVVSPDGTIWVPGPRAAHVTQLTREGRMRRWFIAGGADENDPEISQRQGPLVALPSGEVVAAVYRVVNTGAPGFLTVMRPTMPFAPAAPAISGAQLPGLDIRTQLAVGPGGMVYAMAGGTLYATCRGLRRMWTLRDEAWGDVEPRMGNLFVEANGAVLVTSGRRAWRVRPGSTTVQTSFPVLSSSQGDFISYIGFSGEDALISVSRGRTNYVLLNQPEVRIPRPESYASLSPIGDIAYTTSEAGFVLSPPYEDPTQIPFGRQYALGHFWTEDGDWVGDDLHDGGVARFSPAGSRWVVSPGNVGEDIAYTNKGALDEQGVFFGTMNVGGAPIELFAMQTDALPAPRSMCVDPECNAQHDNWIRPAME